jgi:hypothetical protein
MPSGSTSLKYDTGFSILDAGYLMLDTRYSILGNPGKQGYNDSGYKDTLIQRTPNHVVVKYFYIVTEKSP